MEPCETTRLDQNELPQYGGSEIIYAASVPHRVIVSNPRYLKEPVKLQSETQIFIYKPSLDQRTEKTSCKLTLNVRISTSLVSPENTRMDSFVFTISGVGITGLRGQLVETLKIGSHREGALLDRYQSPIVTSTIDNFTASLRKFAVDHPEVNFDTLASDLESVVREFLATPEAIRMETQAGILALDQLRNVGGIIRRNAGKEAVINEKHVLARKRADDDLREWATMDAVGRT